MQWLQLLPTTGHKHVEKAITSPDQGSKTFLQFPCQSTQLSLQQQGIESLYSSVWSALSTAPASKASTPTKPHERLTTCFAIDGPPSTSHQ